MSRQALSKKNMFLEFEHAIFPNSLRDCMFMDLLDREKAYSDKAVMGENCILEMLSAMINSF
jgi:hypothetical protein